ncbi:MAG: ABC transporter substrate-binding protein [Micrococcales bacterium]|nr:ABC transporter substrate-binding protein [Micrococcales bacterium]
MEVGIRFRVLVALGATAALALTASACTKSDGRGLADRKTQRITVETVFDTKTLDPARVYDQTGRAATKAVYDTLMTFSPDNLQTPIPDLASGFTQSDDMMEFTFTLDKGRVFSDGSPVTADDVVFSLKRLQGIGATASPLLEDMVINKLDELTVEIITGIPCPALPAILTTPATAIVSKSLVEANGGTMDAQDGAEDFLNKTSAGSGPYMLEWVDPLAEIILVKNPRYNGPQKPTYEKVIFQNADTATQVRHLGSGLAQVAAGLEAEQATQLPEGIELHSTPSATIVYLVLPADPSLSMIASNPRTWDAVKYALDYEELRAVGSHEAIQASGMIPFMISGHLPLGEAPTRDLEAAKEAARDAGLDKTTLTLSYPNNTDPEGLSLTRLAALIQVQLAEAGIAVELDPLHFVDAIDAYRGHRQVMGLWYWNTDYLDPTSYLAFGPGQTVAERIGWKLDADPSIVDLIVKATTTPDPTIRKDVLSSWARRMNDDGPFIPLVEPAMSIGYHPSVTGVHYNPVWLINVANLGYDESRDTTEDGTP